MFNRMLDKFKGKMFLQPVEYELSEVMNAWVKVDRILKSAYTDVHIDCAQNLFDRMLSYYGFTNEQRQSPLIAGMQDKINKARDGVIITRR